MGLAFPLGLLLGALAIPLVVLYILKLRRRDVEVGSLFLWRRVLEDRRAQSPWERLRRNLLLLLQLLVLALLALAFAAPWRTSQLALGQDDVIVLDVSASMGAHAGGPSGSRTRLDEAKSRVLDGLRGMPQGGRVALVLAGPSPEVAASLTSDVDLAIRALASARATEAPADLAAALELAATLVRGRPDSEIVFVTDGAFETSAKIESALARCRVVQVGKAADNLGIVAAALRPSPDAPDACEVLVGVSGRASRQVPASVALAVAKAPSEDVPVVSDALDWKDVARESVLAGDGHEAGAVFRLRAEPGSILRITLSGDDALAADDRAFLVVPARSRVRALVISPKPALLTRALTSLDGVEVVTAAGTDAASADDVDLVVLDGPLPEVLPPRPLLAFGGPPPATLAPDAPTRWDAPVIVEARSDHPVLRHVHLDDLEIASAWAGPPPAGADILLESDKGPLAFAWRAPGGRALQFRFDLVQSDLPLRVAFPVLLSDAVDWLTARDADAGVAPTGQAREIVARPAATPPGAQGADALNAVLVTPSGATLPLEIRSGGLVLPPLREAGLFVVRAPGMRPGRLLVATALLSAEESDLTPRGLAAGSAKLAVAASVGAAGVAAPGVAGRKPVWPLALMGVMSLLVAEWAVQHRRRE